METRLKLSYIYVVNLYRFGSVAWRLIPRHPQWVQPKKADYNLWRFGDEKILPDNPSRPPGQTITNMNLELCDNILLHDSCLELPSVLLTLFAFSSLSWNACRRLISSVIQPRKQGYTESNNFHLQRASLRTRKNKETENESRESHKSYFYKGKSLPQTSMRDMTSYELSGELQHGICRRLKRCF